MSVGVYIGSKYVDWNKIYPLSQYDDYGQNKRGMVDYYLEEYSNAGGYGFWCGKKCRAKKEASCTPIKFGKQKGQLPPACAAAQNAAYGGQGSGSGSKTAAIVIGGVLVVGAIVGVIVLARRK